MKTTYIVTGHPRSRTSQTMEILEAGGIPAEWNHKPSKINPNGNYEKEDVGLDLSIYAGKSIKALDIHALFATPKGKYKVILPIRDAEQIRLSTKLMRGGGGAGRDVELLKAHYDLIRFVVNSRNDMELLEINTDDYFTKNKETMQKIATFVEVPFDVEKAELVTKPELNRTLTEAFVDSEIEKKKVEVMRKGRENLARMRVLEEEAKRAIKQPNQQ